MKKTKKVALSAIFTALCVIIMFLGSLLQIFDLTAVMISSAVVLITMMEIGRTWALSVYAASSVLSLVILPDKFAAFVFALFVGFYPILKEPLNKIKPKWLSYLTRFVCFNIFFAALFFIQPFLPEFHDATGNSYRALVAAFCLLVNFAFICFDIALEKFAISYIVSIRPRIFGKR